MEKVLLCRALAIEFHHSSASGGCMVPSFKSCRYLCTEGKKDGSNHNVDITGHRRYATLNTHSLVPTLSSLCSAYVWPLNAQN